MAGKVSIYSIRPGRQFNLNEVQSDSRSALQKIQQQSDQSSKANSFSHVHMNELMIESSSLKDITTAIQSHNQTDLLYSIAAMDFFDANTPINTAGNTLVQLAALKGNPEALDTFIELNADTKITTANNMSLLHFAAASGSLPTLLKAL